MENKLLEIINFYKNYVKELSESYKDITTGEGQEPYEWQRENLAQECNKIEDQVIDPLQEVLDFIKKRKKQENPQRPQLNIVADSGSVGCAYWVTPHLRYTKKQIMIDEQAFKMIDEQSFKYELRLQQMWQGRDGSQKWEWVEVV